MKDLKRLLTLFMLSLSLGLSADDGPSDIADDTETPTCPPGQDCSGGTDSGGGSGGGGIHNPGTKRKRNVPIDMHTSALLVAGMGIIASYAYFARRRKEEQA